MNTNSNTQPRILCTLVPRRTLACLARPLALLRSPVGKLLLWGSWSLGFGWAIGAGTREPVTWNPGSFLLLLPALVGAAILHELCHASAAMSVGAPVPAIGVAARQGLGVYAYTDLSGVPRGPRARLAGVLMAGYDAEGLTMLGLLASAAAAPDGSVLRGTLLVAHAGIAAATVVCFWPASPLTDGGRLLRLLRSGRSRPRLAATIHWAWAAGSAATLIWMTYLLSRGAIIWRTGGPG